MTAQETDGVRSFAASNSFEEDLPELVEGNMQDTSESLLRNSMIEPRIGMEFDSLLQITEFYKNYTYSKRICNNDKEFKKKEGL